MLHADKPFKKDACFVAEIWMHPALSSTYRSPFSDNAAVLNILFIEIKWTPSFPSPKILLEKMTLLPCSASQTGYSHQDFSTTDFSWEVGEEHNNFLLEFEPLLAAAVEAGSDPSTGELECQPVPGCRTTGSGSPCLGCHYRTFPIQ